MNKKCGLIAFVCMLSLLLVGGIGTGYAQVGGVCSNCHTMHYSQDGVDLTTGGPHAALLKDNCLGCHTGAADPLDDDDNTPYVASSTSAFTDDLCLAGGFFPATMGTGNNNDNHHGVVAAQTNAPAGYDGTFYTGGTNGLGCAGTNGCHGNETDLSDMDAISGGHHNTAATYRMLYVAGTAVAGSPAEDYEETIIQLPGTPVVSSGIGQNVNIYSAGTTAGTISELCGKCHGNFHGSGASSNTQNAALEWIRHPTENQIPTTWAIGLTGYTPLGVDYKNHPPGYDNASLDITEKRVTCLSCHRAHGTGNDDLLRWAYTTQTAGGGNTVGCLGCHDAQR